jgi:hypothetical protein
VPATCGGAECPSSREECRLVFNYVNSKHQKGKSSRIGYNTSKLFLYSCKVTRSISPGVSISREPLIIGSACSQTPATGIPRSLLQGLHHHNTKFTVIGRSQGAEGASINLPCRVQVAVTQESRTSRFFSLLPSPANAHLSQ